MLNAAQAVNCEVFYNGMRANVRLVVIHAPNQEILGRIIGVEAKESDADLASHLYDKIINFRTQTIFVNQQNATFVSADQGPSP